MLAPGRQLTPTASGQRQLVCANPSAGAPPAEAAQDEQPTTPGGEEQNGGEQTPDEPAETVEEPGTDDVGGTVGDTGSATSGLPSTGLELSAMAVIGLGLLLLGAALRPNRSSTAGRR